MWVLGGTVSKSLSIEMTPVRCPIAFPNVLPRVKLQKRVRGLEARSEVVACPYGLPQTLSAITFFQESDSEYEM